MLLEKHPEKNSSNCHWEVETNGLKKRAELSTMASLGPVGINVVSQYHMLQEIKAKRSANCGT